MLNGFATLSYYADDLDAAEAWYSEVLGIPAYFHVPGYVEFRVGDYEDELGIIDARYAISRSTEASGAIIQWQVDDVDAALARLLDRGASLHQPVIDRGHGFRTAAVVDPFGNILGVMDNPHYVAVRELLKVREADFTPLQE